jgi:hypothetical protein
MHYMIVYVRTSKEEYKILLSKIIPTQGPRRQKDFRLFDDVASTAVIYFR